MSILKIQVIVNATMYIDGSSLYITISKKDAQYIQKNNIQNVQIKYDDKEYKSKIYFQEIIDDSYLYYLTNNKIFYNKSIENITLIVDDVNLYQYYCKKL
ncbi:hypothetical protein II654_00115 [bacterium]|nr:hypothetical protein [bacterium]